MAGKTFEQYKAEHTSEPFELPMPDGTTVALPKGSIDQHDAIKAVVAAATAAGELTRFTGTEVLVGADVAAEIAEAWGQLEPKAWDAVMADMQEHFGQGNSDASPPS
ncbi:MAG TPA: hypothetical protein VHX15_15700 [Frankiaceae bacterium]|jgi:hypothetical protein|nr:hypothetical protein [Frankiaceae bacterium]